MSTVQALTELSHRADEVAAALEKNGLHVFKRREQKGWVSLAARR